MSSAVIAMVALGNGAQNSVKERLARLGTTVLQINPQRIQQGGVGTASVAKLTTKDVDMIGERSPNVVAVNWQQDRPLQVVWQNKNTNVQVTGTAPNFLEVRGFRLALGRMFTTADDNGRGKVAVLGAVVIPLLGVASGEELLDERIRIAGRAFKVIGVLAARGQAGFGDADGQILIPFRTGRYATFGTDRLNDIWALAGSEDSVTAAMGGGAIGIGTGMFAASQLHRTMAWNTAVDTHSILLAFAFASATGLIFGVWPARRAASLDPIEALRYE